MSRRVCLPISRRMPQARTVTANMTADATPTPKKTAKSHNLAVAFPAPAGLGSSLQRRTDRGPTAGWSHTHEKRRGHRTPAFTERIRKRQKKSLLLLGGLLLGSWLLSSLLLRGHIRLPPSIYFGPDEWFW